MALELDQIVDELYGLTPDAFTAARDRQAVEARKAGERDVAAAVKKLRRPTLSAWMANALVRRHGADVERLLDLGTALRDAQDRLAGDELRRLSQGRHQVVTGLARQGRALGEEAGLRVGEPAERELEGTLEAAMSDPAAAEALRSGCLTTALRYAGLGFGDPGEAVAVVRRAASTPSPATPAAPAAPAATPATPAPATAAPAPAAPAAPAATPATPAPATAAPAPPAAPAAPAPDAAAAAAAAAAAVEVEAARAALEDARAHAHVRDEELAETRQEQDRIRDQIRALRRQIEGLEDDETRAARRVDDVTRSLGAAGRDVRAAERRLSQAEAALEDQDPQDPQDPGPAGGRGAAGTARSLTISTPGKAVSSPGGPTTLHARLPPPRTIRSLATTRSSTQIAMSSGSPNGVTPPRAIPVSERVSSVPANDAFFTPNRRRTAPLTSRRVVASRTQATYRGGLLLPMTTIVLAESSGA